MVAEPLWAWWQTQPQEGEKSNPVECTVLCWVITASLEHTSSVGALPSFDLRLVHKNM